MTLRNWRSVAEKDFRDAVRSRSLLVITVLFLLFVGGMIYLYAFLFGLDGGQGGQGASIVTLLTSLNSAGGIFIPLMGLAVSYKAIAGERDTGQIKLLLSLPHTRTDVLVGKLVGRTGVLFIAVVLGFLVGAVLAVIKIGFFSPVIYLVYLLVTLVYAFTFVAIGVSLSAVTKSSARAALAAIGLFALFQFVWGFAVNVLIYVRTGSFPLFSAGPAWAQFLSKLNPQEAYGAAVRESLRVVAPAQTQPQPAGQPLYLDDGFGLFILLLWVVVPLVLAYFRFTETDLT